MEERRLSVVQELMERAIAGGMKVAEVAAVMGIDASKASRVRTGERRATVEETDALRQHLEDHFFDRLGKGMEKAERQQRLATNVTPAPMPDRTPSLWPRDVPIVGGSLAAPMHIIEGGEELFIEQTELDFGADPDFAKRPPSFATNRSIYCVYVWGTSMEPRYDAGDPIYVDPRRPPVVGDDVVVQLRESEGDDQRIVCALIKRLVRRNATTLELEQYNPHGRFTIRTDRVAALHRVVPRRELL